MIEKRLEDKDCTLEKILKDNAHYLHLAKKHHESYFLIDKAYTLPIKD